jgi:hypothetical protein
MARKRPESRGLPPELLRLEGMLTHKDGFGLETATNLQRAICRSLDGEDIGELWDDPEVRAGFGGVKPEAWRPKVFVIAAAIRCAKSMIIAAKAICLSQTVDLTGVTVGDEIRIPILAPEKDEARAVFSHIVGHLYNKPKLRELMVEEPTADAVKLRHPSGYVIEIKVTALSRFATTLIGRWLPAAIFDEAPRMVGEQDGVRNLPDALNAIAGRIRPGGTIMLIGSPHAPFGPMYDMINEHFGKPTRDCVVVRATGPAMNPGYWTPEKCEDLKRTNPAAYRTDVLAEFADPEEAMFGLDLVEACTRKQPVVRDPVRGRFYVGAMDPATRGNAWTFVLLEGTGWKEVDGVMRQTFAVALTREWRGSKEKPLRPDLVFAEMGALMSPYGANTVVTDQYACDALAPLATPHGLMLIADTMTQQKRFEYASRLKLELEEGCFELPPDPQLARDLVSVRRRITQNGVTLHLPETSDGRHADYVPALMLAVAYQPMAPELTAAPIPEFKRLAAIANPEPEGDFWDNLCERMAS